MSHAHDSLQDASAPLIAGGGMVLERARLVGTRVSGHVFEVWQEPRRPEAKLLIGIGGSPLQTRPPLYADLFTSRRDLEACGWLSTGGVGLANSRSKSLYGRPIP